MTMLNHLHGSLGQAARHSDVRTVGAAHLGAIKGFFAGVLSALVATAAAAGAMALKDVYFGIALSGMAGEGMIINDTPGIYYLLKRNADGAIDPGSGEHGAISAAYHIEAVPVFAIAPKGGSDPRTAAARTP